MIHKGPFTVRWGQNTLEEIETVDIQHEVDSEDYQANSGLVYQIDKTERVLVRMTFLSTDIASLAAVLPQYYVAQGEQLANGEFVNSPQGAIDIVPHKCDEETLYNDLDIIACGVAAEGMRIKNARTLIDNVEIGKIRKIVVKFIGEPEPGDSILQLLGDEELNDFFILDSGENFILDDGNYLEI